MARLLTSLLYLGLLGFCVVLVQCNPVRSSDPGAKPDPIRFPVKPLTWSQFSGKGIQMSAGSPEVWHAGHLDDVIPLDGDAALVASSTGGIWKLSSAGASLSLSDAWDNPDNPRLARGFLSKDHFFASAYRVVPNRKASLYESNYKTSVTDDWHEVTIPSEITQVHRLASSSDGKKLLLATDVGLYWTPAIAPYSFKRAVVADPQNPNAGSQAFWDVAYGYPPGQIINAGSDIILATSLPGGGRGATLYYGVVSGSDIVLTPSTLHFDPASTPSGIGVTSVALSAGSPNVAYAVSVTATSSTTGAAGAEFPVAQLWKSGDAGRTWVGSLPPSLVTMAGRGFDPTWGLTIAVSPTQPEKVAVGWLFLAYSIDGGNVWSQVQDPGDHPDHHRVVIEGGSVHSCSDGGLLVMKDDFSGFVSTYNSNLANLQFLAPMGQRQWYGLAAVSPSTPGLAMAGSQDNGDLFSLQGGGWQHLTGGDGSMVMFLANGIPVYRSELSEATSATWDPGTTSFKNGASIPLQGTNAGIVGLVGSVVTFPVFHNAKGQAMQAVAGSAVDGSVHGLFAEPDGADMHWEKISQLANKSPIYAIASVGGDVILSGAGDGNLYVTNSKDGTTTVATGLPSKQNAGVAQIVPLSKFQAVLIWNQYLPISDGSIVVDSGFYVSSDGGSSWVQATAKGLPKDTLWGMAAAQSGDQATIYVTTDDAVYGTNDLGDTWTSVGDKNLPRRPHCADLRVVSEAGKRFLYMSTFGRSFYRAALD